MRRLVLSMFVSLDGVAETPEKWQGAFWNDETQACAAEMLWDADALLLGRKTYEIFAEAWPTEDDDDEFANRMNSLPKYVVSDTLDDVEWNASLIVGDLADEIATLKEQPGQDILIYGSANLVRTLMRHDLIDEYRFWVHPVVVGGGARMFESGLDTADMRLVDTRICSSGVVILSYQPAN
jgi:dihydrofolate reductase